MLQALKKRLSIFPIQIGKSAIALLSLVLVTSLQVMPANASILQPTIAIGLKHQVEGAVEQGAGKVQQQVGQTTAQAEGLAREAKGKAKRDIGRVESAAESLGNSAEDMAKDSRNSLNDIGDKVDETTNGIAESIKDFFD